MMSPVRAISIFLTSYRLIDPFMSTLPPTDILDGTADYKHSLSFLIRLPKRLWHET